MTRYKITVSQSVRITGELEVESDSSESAESYVANNWPDIDEVVDWDYIPDSWEGDVHVERVYSLPEDDFLDY